MNYITVVISDIHSRWTKLVEALTMAGVLNDDLTRNPGYQLIQVGDAVSAGYGMKEAQFYRDWVDLLEEQDVELVGNHEAPILIPSSKPSFYGYRPGDMGTDGCDPELRVEVLARQKHYKVAHVANDWLITHAGVAAHYRAGSPDEVAGRLNELWEDHLRTTCTRPLFDCAICNTESGILWVRDLEKAEQQVHRIKQMFGHTPDGPTLSRGATMWNIDTPRLTPPSPLGYTREKAEVWGGVCAMKWNDDNNDWEQFYVR